MEKALKKYGLVFALPTFVAFAIGFIWPFIQGLYLSFCQFITIDRANFTGIENYIQIFQDKEFLSSFWFTAKFAIVSVASINIIAFALALLLTKGLKGTNIFRTVFFLPNLIGGIVLGYI